MAWFIKGSDIREFMKSPAFKEMERQIEEIGKLFEAAGEATRRESWKMLDELARRDAERDRAEEQGLVEEVEFEEAQQEETREVAEKLPLWFPALASKSPDELIHYAHAFMSYHIRKKETN